MSAHAAFKAPVFTLAQDELLNLFSPRLWCRTTLPSLKKVDLSSCIAFIFEEFAEAFAHIVSGRLPVGALITSHVGL